MPRHALLIGVSEFADTRLARLNAPVNDVIALRSILADGSRGNFDAVELSLNEDFLAVRDRLSRFFHDRTPDDLLLLYYSGHGILGRGNRLFLATAGSDLDTPRDRSLSAKEIREFIEESRAERQIIVLDCCHSGAFAEHTKAASPATAVTSETFSAGDAGLYVLTAADALQFAWDGSELRSGNGAAGGFSRFTSWLVEGLKKGEAAPDDEQITMDALYRYLFRRARSEGFAATPQRFVQGGVGDLVISSNPLAGSSRIDPEILAALAAAEFRLRLGAVAELTLLMGGQGGAGAPRAARVLLQRHLQHERDYLVRQSIMSALVDDEKGTAPAAQQAADEKQQAAAVRLAEEGRQRAEAARLAEEKQRTEAARLAEEKQRWAEEEKRRAEAAQGAPKEEPPRGKGQASEPALHTLSWYPSRRQQIVSSSIGVAAALFPLLFVPPTQHGQDQLSSAIFILVVASLASVTLLAMILGPKRPAYVLTGLNLLLFALATVLLLVRAAVLEPAITAMMGFFALAFAIESAATALTVWSRNSPGRRRQGAKPKECHS